jgi:hypothetical protein
MKAWAKYFLEPNRLDAFALDARVRFGPAVHARALIFEGGRSGKRWTASHSV